MVLRSTMLIPLQVSCLPFPISLSYMRYGTKKLSEGIPPLEGTAA